MDRKEEEELFAMQEQIEEENKKLYDEDFD